jgi:hypothetical protein
MGGYTYVGQRPDGPMSIARVYLDSPCNQLRQEPHQRLQHASSGYS